MRQNICLRSSTPDCPDIDTRYGTRKLWNRSALPWHTPSPLRQKILSVLQMLPTYPKSLLLLLQDFASRYRNTLFLLPPDNTRNDLLRRTDIREYLQQTVPRPKNPPQCGTAVWKTYLQNIDIATPDTNVGKNIITRKPFAPLMFLSS